MIVLVDHFDSFVETLARYFREQGEMTKVIRVDRLDTADLKAISPRAIVLSPGPGRPQDTPQTVALFEQFPDCAVLGVCLGHQALCEAYGGQTIKAKAPMHGRASPIYHEKHLLFTDIPSPFMAGKYHSLIGNLPDVSDLVPIAWDDGGELMAAAHRSRPHFGVQFHPESLLTPAGRQLISNFLVSCGGRHDLV